MHIQSLRAYSHGSAWKVSMLARTVSISSELFNKRTGSLVHYRNDSNVNFDAKIAQIRANYISNKDLDDFARKTPESEPVRTANDLGDLSRTIAEANFHTVTLATLTWSICTQQQQTQMPYCYNSKKDLAVSLETPANTLIQKNCKSVNEIPSTPIRHPAKVRSLCALGAIIIICCT